MSKTRQADSDLQDDVDKLILDYLVYTDTTALLQRWHTSLYPSSDETEVLEPDHNITLAQGGFYLPAFRLRFLAAKLSLRLPVDT